MQCYAKHVFRLFYIYNLLYLEIILYTNRGFGKVTYLYMWVYCKLQVASEF